LTRIVISAFATHEVHAVLKGFIDDWFVPALVEDYIRQHQKPVAPMDQGADYDSRKAKV
jgi:hypothetical protein